jgi:hypothetical protein
VTQSQEPQERTASFRANNRRAVAALGAVAAYAAQTAPGRPAPPPPQSARNGQAHCGGSRPCLKAGVPDGGKR